MRPTARFASANILAQRFHLEEPDWRVWEELLQGVANGNLMTPDGVIPLRKSMPDYSRRVWSPQDEQWRRDVVFHVSGGNTLSSGNKDLDWELKAADPPYVDLIDLLSEFGLNAQQLGRAHIEVVALHAAEIDVTSDVGDADANLACLVANRVASEDVAINYRVVLGGGTVKRGTLRGADMAWEQRPTARRGVGKIEIPSGALIQCFAIVNGHAHHQFWLANPRTLPNPNRAAFEQYDPSLSTLQEFLSDAPRKGFDAHDVEFAVSWLLWMQGFRPAVIGANRRTRDAPDLLVTSPGGHFLVVECTTGPLKADHKLSRVHERAISLRRRLNDSGHSHLRVLPAIVTTLRRDEVKADIEQAERLGILVVTREELEQGVTQSFVLQNADALFANAEKTVLDNQRQYEPSKNAGPVGIS
jgi:hypothetical protein